jgi:hypothetical protein
MNIKSREGNSIFILSSVPVLKTLDRPEAPPARQRRWKFAVNDDSSSAIEILDPSIGTG